MNNNHNPHLSPFDPYRPFQNNSNYATPPNLFMGYQQINRSYSNPISTGTAWQTHYLPHDRTWSGYPGNRTQMLMAHQYSFHAPFTREGEEILPHDRLPEQGMLPNTAYENIHNEISLDGNPQLNLATFVTTWMEPTANRLYAEAFDKNLIDKDEYPKTAEIEERCIRILADLWHAPHPHTTMGVSTIGSSEGCMLGGLALKRRWQNERKRQGKPIDRPNIIFSSAVQVVWKKFANYWDIEPRYVNITPDRPYLDPEGVLDLADENTIGVVATLGVTYTGLYEPVEEIAKALDNLQSRTGLDIPIHVDAASGGFIAPFIQPDIIWDFQLVRVKSINVSGHKYGLVYPGIGWIVWREAEDLPEDLIFRVSYLGGNMPTFALSFTRPSAQVLLQYYNFLRLGKEGYYEVQKASQSVAVFLSQAIQKLGPFELLTDGTDLPVFAWRLKDGYTTHWDLYDLSRQLHTFGWQVPAYPLPPNMENVTIMRVVVRIEFSKELAQVFLMNLIESITYLDSLDRPTSNETKHHVAFHHDI